MKLIVLGCLGVYLYKGEGMSFYLLEFEGFYLFIDVGSMILVCLENYLDLLKLDVVILLYYYYDYIVDLGVL